MQGIFSSKSKRNNQTFSKKEYTFLMGLSIEDFGLGSKYASLIGRNLLPYWLYLPLNKEPTACSCHSKFFEMFFLSSAYLLGSVCMTGNRSIKTEKLNNRHILYPSWNSRLWLLHSSAILKMSFIKLKTKELNHSRIVYPPWNSRPLKAEKLNGRYIPQQSSCLKLVSLLRSFIWIFSNSSGTSSNSSGNSVIATKIINLQI